MDAQRRQAVDPPSRDIHGLRRHLQRVQNKLRISEALRLLFTASDPLTFSLRRPAPGTGDGGITPPERPMTSETCVRFSRRFQNCRRLGVSVQSTVAEVHAGKSQNWLWDSTRITVPCPALLDSGSLVSLLAYLRLHGEGDNINTGVCESLTARQAYWPSASSRERLEPEPPPSRRCSDQPLPAIRWSDMGILPDKGARSPAMTLFLPAHSREAPVSPPRNACGRGLTSL